MSAQPQSVALRQKNPKPAAWVTLSGLPVSFALEWPFHPSKSGADFLVLHGDIRLEDGSDLHAEVAVNLSQTVRVALPSLAPADAEAVVINALRKEIDNKQIEFLKSGKRLPVPVTSRHYETRHRRWSFSSAGEEDIETFLKRKVYWMGMRLGGRDAAVWIADPCDAEYLGSTPALLLEHAKKLAAAGFLVMREAEMAAAGEALVREAGVYEADSRKALADLEAKHKFERG